MRERRLAFWGVPPMGRPLHLSASSGLSAQTDQGGNLTTWTHPDIQAAAQLLNHLRTHCTVFHVRPEITFKAAGVSSNVSSHLEALKDSSPERFSGRPSLSWPRAPPASFPFPTLSSRTLPSLQVTQRSKDLFPPQVQNHPTCEGGRSNPCRLPHWKLTSEFY